VIRRHFRTRTYLVQETGESAHIKSINGRSSADQQHRLFSHFEVQIGRTHPRISGLKQQQREQQRQAALATTVEEFCRNISAALDNPSFETKQKILRLVVEQIEFVEDQITIKHVIPVSDVRLRRNQHAGLSVKQLW
jgi:hypothetical protein